MMHTLCVYTEEVYYHHQAARQVATFMFINYHAICDQDRMSSGTMQMRNLSSRFLFGEVGNFKI